MKRCLAVLAVLILCLPLSVAAITLEQARYYSNVQVYDVEGQYLGYLVDDFAFYVPSARKIMEVSQGSGDIYRTAIYFESEDCTGQAYIRPSDNSVLSRIFRNGSAYYKVKDEPQVLTVISSYSLGDFTCYDVAPDPEMRYAVEEVTLPFTVPVALPLVFR